MKNVGDMVKERAGGNEKLLASGEFWASGVFLCSWYSVLNMNFAFGQNYGAAADFNLTVFAGRVDFC